MMSSHNSLVTAEDAPSDDEDVKRTSDVSLSPSILDSDFQMMYSDDESSSYILPPKSMYRLDRLPSSSDLSLSPSDRERLLLSPRDRSRSHRQNSRAAYYERERLSKQPSAHSLHKGSGKPPPAPSNFDAGESSSSVASPKPDRYSRTRKADVGFSEDSINSVSGRRNRSSNNNDLSHNEVSGRSDRASPRREHVEESGSPPDVKEVYKELTSINAKLKEEFSVLADKEQRLKSRERLVSQREIDVGRRENDLAAAIDSELVGRIQRTQKHYEEEIARLETNLKEKSKENKRLQENFNTLKTANDGLRKELEICQLQHQKLDKQCHSLQARLVNLQRKTNYDERKESTASTTASDVLMITKARKQTLQGKPDGKLPNKSRCGSLHDVLLVLLHWLSDVHLRPAVCDLPINPAESSPEEVHDKCLKVLPPLVELLRESPSPKIALHCLQFVYWSLVLIDQAQDKQGQKSVMSSTLRRLGEELYRAPKTGDIRHFSDDSFDESTGSGQKHAYYFHSSNLHVRFLSSLVILKSITQVDHLAQVLEVLRNDLKTEPAKELFIHYQATAVILQHLKPANKALSSSAVDIYLQMSMESTLLKPFLDSCSTEVWFRTVCLLWRMPGTENKLLEKLSIILQKLSKSKSNRKFFEVFGITSSAQELMRTSCKNPDLAFLSLNLKSILFNLNIGKGTTATGS